MTNERIFNYETKAVEFVDEEGKAEALIAAGNAKKLEIPELDKFEGSADKIHDEFLAARQRILDSDNPAHTDDVKNYEIAKLEEEYRESSDAVDAEYVEWRNQQEADAKKRQARAVVNVSKVDKAVAEQFGDRAAIKLMVAGEDVGTALHEITKDVGYLSDAEKTALLSRLPGLLANVDAKEHQKRALIAAVQDVRTPDILAFNVAKGLPRTVTTKQRMRDVLINRRGGGL